MPPSPSHSTKGPTAKDKDHQGTERGQKSPQQNPPPPYARVGGDEIELHPPRSRPSGSPRASPHPDAYQGAVLAAAQWAHPAHRYSGDGTNAFSPPRSTAVRSTSRVATNPSSSGNMGTEQQDPSLRTDNFTVDLENGDFPYVFSHSFSEDSPARGRSVDTDESQRRRTSPGSSPITVQSSVPLYPDPQRDALFHSSLPGASPPQPNRQGPESQHPYYAEGSSDWYSPGQVDHPGMLYGHPSLQRSPILPLPSPPSKRADDSQRTPSGSVPFPFEPSPPRSTYDSLDMSTPRGSLGGHFSPLGYESRTSHGQQRSASGGRMSESHPTPHAGAAPQPTSSPFMNGLLKDFEPSPTVNMMHRATGPYGRYPYPPPYHYPGHSVPQSSLKSSPVVTQNDARPRRLWGREQHKSSEPSSSTNSSGNALHYEMGINKKALDDINKKMLAARSTPMSQPSTSRHHSSHPYAYHPYYHHMPAPSRMIPPRPLLSTDRRESKTSPPLGRSNETRYPFQATGKKSTPSSARTLSSEPQDDPLTKSKSGIKTTGKENADDSSATSTKKRSPCNCRKSRCLKLYCECFAAEVFCQDCNCQDCCNTIDHKELRDRAIKDTKSKNPKAFQPRFHVDSDNPAQSNHTMGCKCKKSKCLKKYCECFHAGIFCAAKCKCISCANYAGSQMLIDKRRKMKDVRGAKMAMQAAESIWKNQSAKTPSHQSQVPPPPSTTPVMQQGSPASELSLITSPLSGSSKIPPRNHYSSQFRNPLEMNYSPFGRPPVTPGYLTSSHYARKDFAAPRNTHPEMSFGSKRTANKITPSLPLRTPAVRLRFDPSSSRNKRRKGDEDESTFSYFGPDVPKQPRTTALAVFSFLSNEDVYNASLVSKNWKSLAEDGELWQFP